MSKLKIALVSYINTIPFIEAIKSSENLSDNLELIIDYPAKCAELIRNKKVDGGLIPVAALPEIDGYNIFTNYCIGANGTVDTVALFSNCPIEEVGTIYLDYQSRTSVQLVQILAENYWKKDFIYLPTQKGFESNIPKNSAVLIIGDRVFEYEHLYLYKLDLAENWKHYTELPFAFAVWVANDKLKTVENELNTLFEKSVSNISSHYSSLLTIDKKKFTNYLTHKIDFSFDHKKQEAIKLFTNLLNSR